MELSGGSSTTEFKFRRPGSPRAGTQTLRFGTGLDGCFTRTRGFLGGRETHQTHVTTRSNAKESSGQRLPAPLEAWEMVHESLPRLLRAGRVRQAVDALGERTAGGGDAWCGLEQRHLTRAALVLSALAHAYMFGKEQTKGKSKEENGRYQLPRHLLDAWDKVPADDVLNNAVGNSSFSLRSVYFGLPEERLSSGLQGTIESVFAPALSAMALAKSGVLADQPDLVTHCLESLSARIVECAHLFDVMTPRDTAHFDPVIWIKTYPAMGRPVTPGELGNSGVDAPIFHALDAFIGRRNVKGDLKDMQSDRRATLPANIRAFLDALGDRAGGVRDYIATAHARQRHLPSEQQSQYQRLSAAWDGLLQIYVWFLERHRVKAVGVTGVSLGTGRHSTSSGVKSSDQAKGAAAGKPKMRPETMLSMQMKMGMASRLAGRPLWQDARVQSQTKYQGSVVVTVRLDANLPLEPGDRVQIWPPMKRKKVRRTCSHKRQLRTPSPEDHDASPEYESDDEAEPEPRFYSIAHVNPDVEEEATVSGRRGGMTITLTVGQHTPEGLVSSFLSTAAQGTHLRLRPWPSLRFRQPRNMAVPLVLIGQGSGVGPLLGFLHDRATWKQRLGDTQDNIEYRDIVHQLVKNKGGHVFVCGSSDFGETVMSSLGLGQPQQQQQKQAQDVNDESYDDNRTEILPPSAYWNQLHHDLFAKVEIPSISRSSCCSSSPPPSPKIPIISPATLAAHNSMTSCWTAIGGTVYDMTSFLTTHPGGPKTILESAGTVADARFAETHGGPHAQEIRGYLRSYAIGRLSTATADSASQMTWAKLINALVRMQNTLTNNSAFDASRGPVPLYVYEDALLVFADGLDGIADILSDVSDDNSLSELRETVVNTQALLRKAFVVLKDGCKGSLVAAGSKGSSPASSTLLDESEDLVRKLYRGPIRKVHTAIDVCKKDVSEIEARTETGSSDAMCDTYEDENADALKRVLEKFCTSLASVAKDLLY
ncbi:cytochrome b5-like Heme/Steroid binding domain-containing protein [Colletotrichum navitas]|uniref:Cytochrome b5-like Heme/Steroid binding domain-containing protein n=1 Tax=Colletotrichum navitas TaxID=681940 RepID=A0AAD8V2N0_9PEZI|nr:cytochrome b5-like Heme/Steroid binding domain-containing protein [Colletotrichum navitas]KAK1579939.1 cytochrome b5-like Heme/Steroid binding domain-containing protein [Colletotrichum navitas]